MARESHTMEAIIVYGYQVYKEIWWTSEVIDHLLRGQLINRAIMMTTSPANHTYLGRENLRAGIYFKGFIFMVYQSTTKITKIGPCKNFPLYSSTQCH